MPSPLKDILIVGYGPVGAIYAHSLTRGGLARVTVVARSNYEIAKDHGIDFKSKIRGNFSGFKPYRLVNSIESAADREYAYVCVATKATPDVCSLPDILAPILDPAYERAYGQPTFILLQNGLNVERDLYDALIKTGTVPSIVGAAVFIGANFVESNVVEQYNFDRLTIGIYRPDDFTTTSHTTAETAMLSNIKTIFTSGGTEVTIASEIQRVKFIKNLWNLSFSCIATLTRSALPSIYRSKPAPGEPVCEPYLEDKTADLVRAHTVPIVKAVMMEAITVARAIGFPDSKDGVPTSVVDDTIGWTVALHNSPQGFLLPSMLLDVERGHPLEVEVIVGEVVRMAKTYNVDVPRIEMIYALLLVVQNQTLRRIGKRRF